MGKYVERVRPRVRAEDDAKQPILVWPNHVPFNAMALTGELQIKTRNSDTPPALVTGEDHYRGKVLFYNSGSTRPGIIEHLIGQKKIDRDSPLLQKGVIIGEANLVSVKPVTLAQARHFINATGGHSGPLYLAYRFEDKVIYKTPIPVEWPKGVVQGAWIDPDSFQTYREQAIKKDAAFTEPLEVQSSQRTALEAVSSSPGRAR